MVEPYRELLIGCGQQRVKYAALAGHASWEALTTLDINPAHNPDVVHDLNVFPYPFLDNTFEEIHAYEVLEHLGVQGDAEAYFGQFSEFWRILKPGGYFFGSCPDWQSVWAWADPSHRRIITQGTLTFLSQAESERQVGVTQMSDFRYMYKADFDIIETGVHSEKLFFTLRAIKPSRASQS